MDDDRTVISAPPAASVTIDPQDPLPESDFRFRRWTTWGVLTAVFGLVFYAMAALNAMHDAAAIYSLARWLLALAWTIATYYYAAPSAEQIIRIIHTARIAITGLRASAEAGQPAEPETRS
jgi:hypothetical protein